MIAHAGRTLALIEGGLSNYELTDELDTVGVCDFDGTLTGRLHRPPQADPETGELHAVSYSINRGNTVQYSVIDVEGRARRTVDIEVAGSPMMHDFSLTEGHVVFYDLPVTFDAKRAAAMSVRERDAIPSRLTMSASMTASASSCSLARQPHRRSERAAISWSSRSLTCPHLCREQLTDR